MLVLISIFFSSWSFVGSIKSIAPPWPLVRMITEIRCLYSDDRPH